MRTEGSGQGYEGERSTTWILLGLALFVAAIGSLLGSGAVSRHIAIMSLVFIVSAYLIGRAARSRLEPWLPVLMTTAMAAKLVGSSVRYYVLEVIYQGSGDAGRYHNFAVEIADVWRGLEVPNLATVAFGSQGTRFIAWVTGLLYAPFEPSQLGGFFIHAFLAFVGQFFFYRAFRLACPDSRWKRYAILIFFWPTLVYWPSSIGKESFIILFLGLGSWAAAALYRRYEVRWLPLIGVAAFMVSVIRVHVAALFVGALLAGVIIENRKSKNTIAFGRLLILIAGLAAAVPLVLGVADEFNLELTSLSADDLEPVFADVGDTTEQGGSSVSGGVIRGPLDIPEGILKVLFRPLPNEARNAQSLVASAEGVILLGLVIWQIPAMFRNRAQLRKSPYLLLCLVYVALFIWGWSAILNLGIMARQRSLVIPFLLALIAGLGWQGDREATASEGVGPAVLDSSTDSGATDWQGAGRKVITRDAQGTF